LFYLQSAGTVRPVRVDITVCSGFFQRLKGALGAGRIPFRRAYLFPGVRTIHTIFMRSSISVLSFQSDGTILEYNPKLDPFRVFSTSSDAWGLLELAPGRLPAEFNPDEDVTIRFPPDLANRIDLPDLEYNGPKPS
jgi:hypothetical protein